MRFAIYLRKSVDVGDRDQSIETQRQACRRLLPRGARIDEYLDLESGGKVGRADYQRLLASLNLYDGLVAWELSRLGRRAIETLRLLDELERNGKQLLLVNGMSARTRKEFDQIRMPLQMVAVIDEEERRRTGRRIRDVNERLVRAGRYVGARPPFGYNYDREKKRLVVNPHEARIVREIFRYWIDDRLTARRIAGVLTERGIRTRWGRPWRAWTIMDIIRRHAYAGRVSYGRFYQGSDGRRHRREDYLVAEGKHKAIIPRKRWDEAQRIDHRSKTLRPVRSRDPRPLSAVVRCGLCGAYGAILLGGRKPDGTAYRYYGCSVYQQAGRRACAGPRATALWLEAVVVNALADNCRNAEGLLESVRRQAVTTNPGPTVKDRVCRIERRLADAVWLFDHDGIDRREFLRRKKAYDAELAAIKTERCEAAIEPPRDFHAIWERGSAHQRRALIAELIEHIDIHRDRVEIHYRPLRAKGWIRHETIARPRRVSAGLLKQLHDPR